MGTDFPRKQVIEPRSEGIAKLLPKGHKNKENERAGENERPGAGRAGQAEAAAVAEPRKEMQSGQICSARGSAGRNRIAVLAAGRAENTPEAVAE